MKIYDITKIATQCEVKPELKSVFVKHTDKGIIYVATDTFRLIEIKLENEDIKSILPEGFYNLKQWALLAKETQKKNPDADLMLSIKPMENKDSWHYPEYANIIPKEVEDNIHLLTEFNIHLVSESFKVLEQITKKPWFTLLRCIKQSEYKNGRSEMMYLNTWSDNGKSEITFLVASLNK